VVDSTLLIIGQTEIKIGFYRGAHFSFGALSNDNVCYFLRSWTKFSMHWEYCEFVWHLVFL